MPPLDTIQIPLTLNAAQVNYILKLLGARRVVRRGKRGSRGRHCHPANCSNASFAVGRYPDGTGCGIFPTSIN